MSYGRVGVAETSCRSTVQVPAAAVADTHFARFDRGATDGHHRVMISLLRSSWRSTTVLALALAPAGCGDAECEALAPAEPEPLELRVVNHRSEPIYLDIQCTGVGLERVDGDAQVYADPCSAPACSAAIVGDCTIYCGVCATGVLSIAPGATHVERWSRTVFENADLGKACSDACGDRCVREVDAPRGDYRATASAFSQCPLAEGCACPPGSAEPCLIPYLAYPDTPAETREVEFSLPRDGAVEIAFD